MAEEVIRDVPARYPVRPARFGEVFNRVSWGAIWAGALIALGMEALFTVFGIFIGFDMWNGAAANPWAGIRGWSIAWYLVTAGWSMFIGAWCASRFAASPLRGLGILHGMTTWGVATFATLLLVGVVAWGILREGIILLVTGAAAPAAGGANPAATAGAIRSVSDIIWIGLIVGLGTAILGGWLGRPRMAVIEGQEVPGPSRLAA